MSIKRTVNWQDEADAKLRGVLTTALEREPSHDIQFNRHAIQKGGPGSGRVVLWAIESVKGTGAAIYGATRRGLISVASQVAALSTQERFFVTSTNAVATMVGLHVMCDLLGSGSKGVVRQGLVRNPNEAQIGALAAEGVAPIMAERGANGSKRMIGCEPINPKDARWAKATKQYLALCEQYEGSLGADEEGEPRTAEAVCDDVIKREREMKDRNAKAAARNKADKEAKLVKMPTMKATQPNLDAFLKAARGQGVDTEDPAALGEFACGAVVLAYAVTETPKAKKTA